MEWLPPGEGLYRELSWLTTLAPAFILSLHYGMLGALSGLVAGTLLYITVQLVLQLKAEGRKSLAESLREIRDRGYSKIISLAPEVL